MPLRTYVVNAGEVLGEEAERLLRLAVAREAGEGVRDAGHGLVPRPHRAVPPVLRRQRRRRAPGSPGAAARG